MRRTNHYPEWLIVTGGCFFIFVLALSAYWEAEIRWLHFFQSWMYLAAIVIFHRYCGGRVLVLRQSLRDDVLH